jgi:hypothetical protein
MNYIVKYSGSVSAEIVYEDLQLGLENITLN